MVSIIELSAYISLIFYSLVIILFIWLIFFFTKWADKNLIPAFTKVIGEADKPVYNVPSTIREVLINDCINDKKLRCFFYIDVPLITELYYQIEQQQPIKKTEKISKGKKQNVGGNLKIQNVGAEASHETLDEKEVETESCYLENHSSYCKKIMKRLYEDNEVFILDLEERNYKPDIEKTFESCCETLQTECHAPLPEHWLKIYTEQIRQYAISYDGLKKEIEEVCQNKRYVITKGDFKFIQSDGHIFTKAMGTDKIFLEVPFNPEKVARDKFEIINKRKTGNFTVFGTIEHWDTAASKLTIFPIAMY